MAPLTWRNVDAPDLSMAADAMARAAQGIQNAFRAGGEIGRGVYNDQVEIGSREAMRAAQQFDSSQEMAAALKNGTAFGNMDPRFINAQTLQWGDERRRGLLGEEQIIQNMEIQRQQEARAQQAHALRLAGGGGGGGGRSGGGGGGSRGRSGGGGGGGSRSGSSKDSDSFEVAQAEAARRVAVAEYGENSPEALAATNRLAEVSTGAKNRSGLLDAADAYAGAITADKAEAAAAGDAAVAAMSGEDGFNPYAVSLPSASPAADIPGNSIPLTPPDVGASPAAALPASSAPTAPAPAPAPVAEAASSGPNWGFNLGTPLDAPAEAPVEAAIERPSLSFGPDVPRSETPASTEGRPISWGDYARDRLAENSASGSPTASAKSMGMPAAVEELPQWGAYQAEVAAFDQSSKDRAAAAEAERARVEPNEPTVVRNNIDTSRATIDRVVEQNPEFALNEYTQDFRSIFDAKGPEAVTAAVATRLGSPNYKALQEEITLLARDNGVDFVTAAGAMATAGGPENYRGNTFFGEGGNFWDYAGPWNWSPIDGMWSAQHYDPEKAREYIEIVKSSADDPRGRIGQRNELGAIRSELTGIERGYALRMEAEVRARAVAEARPNDVRAQREYEKAKAATLQADKAAVAFRRELNDRLGQIGMTEGVGVRPKVDDYITPQMREEAAVVERERAAEAAANLETFGVERPTFVGFRNGEFNPGNVAADSEFGLRQANQWLAPVLSGRARDTERKSFFEWVAASPKASREIFGRIQDMEYSGQDIDLPETVDRAYQEYTRSNVPTQAINDLTALGFDLSGNPQMAAAVMNDPEVRQRLQMWRDTNVWYRTESTQRFNRQNAQAVIRAALERNQPKER